MMSHHTKPGSYKDKKSKQENARCSSKKRAAMGSSEELLCDEVDQDKTLSKANVRCSSKKNSSEKMDLDTPCALTSEPSCSFSATNKKPCKKHDLYCASHQDSVSSSCVNTSEPCDASDESRNDGKSSTDCVELDDGASSSRQLRKKRTSRGSQNCPVCGLTVRFQDMAQHFEFELRRLQSLKIRKMKNTDNQSSLRQEQVQGIISRRTSRSGIVPTSSAGTNTCPICFPTICSFDSLAIVMHHFTQCLGLHELVRHILSGNQGQNDEVYTFGAADRARLIDLLNAENDASNDPHDLVQNIDESIVVNVDMDEDNDTYGPSEFAECDLRPCESSLNDADRYALREAVLRNSSTSSTTSKNGTGPAEDAVSEIAMCEIDDEAVDNSCFSTEISDEDANRSINAETPDDDATRIINVEISDDDANQSIIAKLPEDVDNSSVTGKIPQENASSESIIISALRQKIDELENERQNNSSKCNICLDYYREPLVSVTCWHVACKSCWMSALGEKKLCPRCAQIILPSDLRRIYL